MSFFSIVDVSKSHALDWADYHFSRLESYSPSAKKAFLQRYIDFTNGLCKTDESLAAVLIGFSALRYPHLAPLSLVSIPDSFFLDVASNDITAFLPYFGLSNSNPLFKQVMRDLVASANRLSNKAPIPIDIRHSRDVMRFLTLEQRCSIAENIIAACKQHSIEKPHLWTRLLRMSCSSFFQRYDIFNHLSSDTQKYLTEIETNFFLEINRSSRSNFTPGHQSLLPLDQYAALVFSNCPLGSTLSHFYPGEYITSFTQAFLANNHFRQNLSNYSASTYFMDETVLDVCYQQDPVLLEEIVSTWNGDLCERFLNGIMQECDRYVWSISDDGMVQKLFSALQNHPEFILSLYTNVVALLVNEDTSISQYRSLLARYCQICPRAVDAIFPEIDFMDTALVKPFLTDWLNREMGFEEKQLEGVLSVLQAIGTTEWDSDDDYLAWIDGIKILLRERLPSMGHTVVEPLSLET